MEAKTAVVYARQSFGLEEGSASIEVQIDACKAWARKNNVNIIGIYEDANTSSELYPFCAEGVEAARCDRGYQRWKQEQRTQGRKEYKDGLGLAFDAIHRQRPTYIIVYTANRLGRSAHNSNLQNFLTSYLMDHNCSIVEAQTGSVQDFSDAIMTAFQSLRNALDFQSVFEKRKASMASIAKRKDAFRVYSNGYGVAMVDGVVAFDSSKAEVIKYIFDSTIEGAGTSQVLAQVNQKYKERANGRQFYETNISHILKNPVYCGYTYNSTKEIGRATNVPEPLISFSTWQKANEIFRTRKAGYQKWNLKEHKQIHWLPWSGYIKCECGRRMTVTFDDGDVYTCKNAGEHTQRLRINAINHNQDFNLTLQALFVINCIKSRKALEATKKHNNILDELKAKQAALESSLKAKFRLIESDDDFNFFKPEIDEIKKQINEVKQQILVAEEEKSIDVANATARLDEDFARIMNPALLPETDYQRLLQATIAEIVVKKDEITVVLTDGKSFDLPRITVNGRGKKVLPWSEIYATTENISYVESITHYDIIFHGGCDRAKILLDCEDYTIWLEK